MNTASNVPSPLLLPTTIVKSPAGELGLVSHTAVAPSAATESLVAAPGTNGASTMANTKEKTPMCLINELARYNKIQHQYRLVDESGLPHKKTFKVVLKLDQEEYTAMGPSIKKAQHSAAAVALGKTSFKHPPPKTQSKLHDPVTPTVELNALAMKRGEPAIYQTIEPQRPQNYYPPSLNYRGAYNQRYHYPKISTPYYVSLKVGTKQFFGKGRTAKDARHCAAEEALNSLRSLPLPDHVRKRPEITSRILSNGGGSGGNDGDSDQESTGDDLKSPISLVHEIALKRNYSVNFEVTKENGPPHMRTFTTKCSAGPIITCGEGKGKKVSKKRAAEKMLDELRKLSPLPPATTNQKLKKKPIVKKKTRNLIKDQNAENQISQGINPISRLIQIQHAKKDKEPVYTVVAERGEPRQREFVIQCTLGDITSNGTGPKKKTAKSNAAENMLQLLGYSRPLPTNKNLNQKAISSEGANLFQDPEKQRKLGFLENEDSKKSVGDGNKMGRQLVPGILIIKDTENMTTNDQSNHFLPSPANGGVIRTNGNSHPPKQSSDSNNILRQTAAKIASELLEQGTSPTAEAMPKSGHHSCLLPNHSTPKQQLTYLAEVIKSPLEYSDFPKSNNKNEFLSFLTLSFNPHLVKYGSGSTLEESHNNAAIAALQHLKEMANDGATKSVAQNNETLFHGSQMRLSNSGQGETGNLSTPTGALVKEEDL